MTSGQQHALDSLFPIYGIPFTPCRIDLAGTFGNNRPVWLEIGFGDGEALMTMAESMPDINFIGIEVHAPGVGHLLARIEERQLDNVKVMRHDAVEVMSEMLAEGSIERVLLLFPDPWHKKRHHKRRILQAETLALFTKILQPGGKFHCATDWAEYAEAMLDVLNSSSLSNLAPGRSYAVKPDYRPLTKFEQRGLKLGHEVFDLLFEKTASTSGT